MKINKIYQYYNGYVNIIVEGFYIERFINVCHSKNIVLWNVVRSNNTILIANVSINDYKEIIKFIKKVNCRVKIKGKKGIPFLINRYRKRKLFVYAFLIMLFSIIILSNFVWNIEITGLNNIDRDEIIQLLEEEGVKIGAWKNFINEEEIINNIRLVRDDIAWVSLKINGTNAKIEIVESTLKPEIVNSAEPCNIIAKKEGLIVKIDVINGTPQVKEGQVVKEGTILIGGWIEGKFTDIRYLHSEGEVWAKVWYKDTERIYFNQSEIKRTGKKENKYAIKFKNFKINLYKIVTKFELCDTISVDKTLKLFSNFYMPIKVSKTTNYELKKNEVNLTESEAASLGEQKAKAIVEEMIEKKENILNITTNTYSNDEYVDVEVIYEVLETIGISEK